MNNDHAAQLIRFIINDIIRPDPKKAQIVITEDTPLITSGMIDSLSLIAILQKVEDVTNTRLPASKIGPKDMNTVALMLATAERLGKPKK